VGVESTILDLSREHPVLLRPGAVTRAQIAAVIGGAPRSRDAQAPRAPGTLAAHYAPATPMTLVAEEEIERLVREDIAKGRRVAVLARGPARASAATLWREAPETAAAYAHDLYANLRILDASGADFIFVEAPPGDAAWEAVNDRLSRAAAGAIGDDKP
jgi:L-threonylcarbamoyladenylate synthase